MLEFAKTPPKGWNSWDVYGASVTEEEVKRNADIMAEKLKVYGWDYVVVDIQWYEPGAESAAYRKFADLKMDEYSRVLPAENRFPSSADGAGFAPLAEYVHKLGLKFGIHILRVSEYCSFRNSAAATAAPFSERVQTILPTSQYSFICGRSASMADSSAANIAL